jgi:hypothetical protein
MMDDLKTKAKQAVLKEIMDLMDSNMVSDLKGHSPKAMVMEVDSKKPMDDESMLDEVKAKLMGDDAEEKSESPAEKAKEMMMSEHDESSDKDDEDEDKQKLLELYSRLK